jgi:hypothetical protein
MTTEPKDHWGLLYTKHDTYVLVKAKCHSLKVSDSGQWSKYQEQITRADYQSWTS